MLLCAISTPTLAQEITPIDARTGAETGTEGPAFVGHVPADSVRMVVLPETGEVGFIVPKSIALHYRNLVLDLLPALEQKIQLLEDASAQQLSLSENRLEQIEQLVTQRNLLQEQVTLYAADATALKNQLDDVNKARKREIVKKKFWRSTNYLFMGTTAILTAVLIAK